MSTWTVEETTYDPSDLNHAETLYAVGNGYFCSRGTFEEPHPGEKRTTFIHGVFDPVPIAFTEIANMPDWTSAVVNVDGHDFAMSDAVTDYRRALDMSVSQLSRSLRWQAPSGAAVRLEFSRFASLADEHLGALTVRVTPEQDCRVVIRVPVHASCDNVNDGKYRLRHTAHVASVVDDEVVGLHVTTLDERYDVALACRVGVVGEGTVETWTVPEGVVPSVSFDATAGSTVGVDKVIAYETSRDGGEGHDVFGTALQRVRDAAGVEELLAASRARWEQDWAAVDVTIDGDDDMQQAVRFNLYHMLIAGPRRDDQVNIGAKTLTGFGYRGHCFWDTEIFMLPLFIHTLPDVARNLLDYRYHRLAGAHKKAAQFGLEGAMFPWESADTGDEVTPPWVPAWDDPTKLVRVWTGVIQIHISADVAYGSMQYWRATGDDDWFVRHGAELVLDTAKYFAARAEPGEDGRFHYNEVIGPDEYHEHVNDNAFTNGMARWNIRTALEVLDWVRANHPDKATDLVERLDLTDERLAHWQDVVDGIVLEVREDGRIEQFTGFFDLIDVNFADHQPQTTSMHVVFGIEGANQRQVLKQPDVLMLTLLLEDEFTDEQRRANYDYYTPRTDHVFGSSLGPAMQAIIAARAGLADDAVEHFERAAYAALRDVRGNVNDGIHAASCGGVWQAVAFGFAGLKIHDDGTYSTHPKLPAGWSRVSFPVTLRGERHRIEVAQDSA
jgi:kojibiose phosphorylase